MTRALSIALLALTIVAAAPPERLSATLSGTLKDLLLDALPNPLFEDAKHWNLQHRNLFGNLKNDGKWWKLRVEATAPKYRLQVEVRDLQPAGKNRQTFTVLVHMDAGILLERQTWFNGLRLYSGSTRARVKLHLNLACEVVSRLETPKGSFIPDMILRASVPKSEFRYGDLVVEHTAGVGGEAAEVIGETVMKLIKQVKPSLERRLLDKANAAIIKAGDSKEVRIGLGGVSREKKK